MTDYLEATDAAGRTLATIPIDREVTKVGSLSSSHLRLEGEGISRMHAVLERSANGTAIIDLGSSTGTFVNGARVNKAELRDGDLIQVGENHLRYRVSGGPISFRSAPDGAEPARKRTPCPRCGSGMTESRWASGGAYRGGVTLVFLRCAACEISVISGETIRARYDRDDAALGGDQLERDRRGSDKTCPHCPGELEHLTLSWASAWVEVEQCPRCGAVVMDDGEGGQLDSLLQGRPG